MTTTELKPCFCGREAQVVKDSRLGGHGYSDTLWRVECSCGMRTIDIVEGWEGTAEECQEKAKLIWVQAEQALKGGE